MAGVSSRRRSRGAAIVLAAVTAAGAVALIATAGGNEKQAVSRSPRPAPAFVVGRGDKSALVVPASGPQRRPAVVFLHGWGLSGRTAYRGWLRHLARRGSTVIVPRYQTSLRTWSEAVPDKALAGVRAALRRIRPRPRSVVVAGHSVGAVLAIDYAARARDAGLPPARAVLALYPGAALRDMPPVPEDDPADIPPTLRRLTIVASPSDRVVGTAPAEAIYARAVNLVGRREIVWIEDPDAGNHFAPVLDTRLARRHFWPRLDALVDRAR